MKQPVTRRTFLAQSAAAGAALPLILTKFSLAAPPSGRLQHAAIGVGGQGGGDLAAINSSGKVDVVALCDVDALNLQRAAEHYPNARLYRDWREMLSQEERNIDSVSVGIPDHMHAPATITAIQMGKHVFCEKPLTRCVYEARKVAEAAKKHGVATQMGNQIHSHDAYRTAVHWLRAGAIGKVKEWHSWCGAVYTTDDKQRPAGSDPVPEHLDWDLWLGVAPERPYLEEVYHPFWWRRFRDFGGGNLGDFGCHILDPIFTALELGAPLTVSCEAECLSREVWPEWNCARYVFPGTSLTAGNVIVGTWMDGGRQPSPTLSKHLPQDRALPGSGSIVIGEEGTLLIPHVAAPKLYPEEKFADYPQPDLEPVDHYHSFVDAALGNGVCGSNFAYAGPLT
jgi:predicted dehydrogenase